MSFKEKSAWISFISTVSIFGYYFYSIFMLIGEPPEIAKEAAKDYLIQAVFLSIVVEIFFHAVLNASNKKEAALQSDERDKAFEYKANSLGYSILVVGVVITLGRIITLEYNPEFAEQHSSLQIPLLTAHILMFTFILSEIVRFGGQIFFYRRGY
ncbi:hypothetical protein BAE46_03755 [Glaciecola punicea]|nr:hypothetical protein BAE46_03755 [Glaciecola punicea]